MYTYERWDIASLESALYNRKIDSSTTDGMSGEEKKTTLVKLLKDADREATFEGFVDLPAELRNKIYRKALVVEGVQSLKRVPAICRVSKQLRNETLPVYFGLNTFEITIYGTVHRIRKVQYVCGEEYHVETKFKIIRESVLSTCDARWLKRHKYVIPYMRNFCMSVTRFTREEWFGNEQVNEHVKGRTLISFSANMQHVSQTHIGIYRIEKQHSRHGLPYRMVRDSTIDRGRPTRPQLAELRRLIAFRGDPLERWTPSAFQAIELEDFFSHVVDDGVQMSSYVTNWIIYLMLRNN